MLKTDILIPRLVLFLYVAPLAIPLGSAEGKPINIALSDLLWLTLPLLAVTGVKVSNKLVLFAILLLYFPVLAILSAILNAGSLAVVFSGISFTMPLMHIIIGYWFWRRYGQEGLTRILGVYTFLIVGVLLSDVLVGSFPRGCSSFEGRWGGCFGPFELYGYPNSPVSFMALLSPILLFKAFTATTIPRQIFYWVLFLILTITVFMSLSRSSSLSILLVLMLFLIQLRPFMAFVTISLSGSAAYVLGWAFLSDSFLFRGLILRINKGVNEDNISGSRFDIWQEAFEIAATSPFIGKAFQYFSSFSEYGTAHQQYAEIFFKSGAIGMFIYFGSLIYFLMMFRRSALLEGARHKRLILVGMNCFVITAFFNGVFQPIMSYQPMGNLMFFLGGIALALEPRTIARSDREANLAQGRGPTPPISTPITNLR